MSLPYIISDLNETIFDSNKQEIPKDTINDINNYQNVSNNKFTICSGRLNYSDYYTAEILNIKLPIISCNGSLITDIKTKKILNIEYLNISESIIIIEFSKKNNIDIILYCDGEMHGNKNSKKLENWKKIIKTSKYKWKIFEYDDLNDLSKKIEKQHIKPIQIVMTFDEKTINNKFIIKNILKDKVNIDELNNNLLIINPYNVNKFFAIKKLAEILKINYKDIIYFGDNDNDYETMKNLNTTYAVANSTNIIKKVATNICDTIQNNGVGKTLKKIIHDKQKAQ